MRKFTKELKRIVNSIGFSTSVILQISLFIFAVALIFATSYIIGFRYLERDTFWGNDTFNFFSVVYWFNKYFPKIPFWYPLQGAGVSFTGYPWFAAIIVILIERLTSLDLVQSFRILGFLSVPLTAIGVFVFAWTRLTSVKPVWMRQVLGLIAVLFYVVSPISWIWLVRWGFYAESVSYIFVPWAVLFFDLFLEKLFDKKFDFLYRVGFAGAVVFWVLAFSVHFYAGVSLIPLFFFLGLIRFIFQKENRWALFKRLVRPLLIFGLVFVGLFIFRYYSYHTYTKAVAVGGFRGYGVGTREGFERNTLTPKMMLSLENPLVIEDLSYATPDELIESFRMTIIDMRYPLYVWILLVPSLILGAFKSKKIFAFSVHALLGFITSTSVDLQMSLGTIPIIGMFAGWMQNRAFFVAARVAIPITAAFGAYVLWELGGSLLLSLFRKIKLLYYALLPAKVLVVLALTLITAGYTVFFFYNRPEKESHLANIGAYNDIFELRDIWHRNPDPEQYSAPEEREFVEKNPEYGWYADYIWMRGICGRRKDYPEDHICNFYTKGAGLFPPKQELELAREKCTSLPKSEYLDINQHCQAFYLTIQEQLAFNNWHWVELSSDIDGEVRGTAPVFDSLPQDKEYRFDFSGFAGRQIMVAPLINDNSQVQVYINTLDLIYNAHNYQSQVMYSQFPLYQKPGVLSELARWFGLNYVFLAGSSLEPLDYWDADKNWEKIGEGQGIWRSFNYPTGITSWDSRPKVLVISDNSKDFYDQSFRFFTWGGLLYDQAMPVKGKKEVDRYTLSELREFDIIFMRGYDYQSRRKAYSLLDRYIKGGGRLIFDTGWQYHVPDFELEKAPDFMPFDSLEWRNLDTDSAFKIEDSEVAGSLDTSNFGPLIWEDTSWGVSVPGSLRDWARPVLSYDGQPLAVVGEYGQGKVAWIGFNIVPHAEDKDSLEEVYFFNKLLEYLNGGFQEPPAYEVTKTRINPDHLEFAFNQSVDGSSTLYFREAYYPDWKAKLVTSDRKQATRLKIHRAGPGFMLMDLPAISEGDRVVLKIEKPLDQYLVEIISAVTLGGLMIYLFFPRVVKSFSGRLRVRKGIGTIFQKTVKGKLSKISASWAADEDDDY